MVIVCCSLGHGDRRFSAVYHNLYATNSLPLEAFQRERVVQFLRMVRGRWHQSCGFCLWRRAQNIQKRTSAADLKRTVSILSSVKELGIIEPLVILPKPLVEGDITSYMLLDGHLRLEALKSLGAKEALCLISTDDEGFTYNRQINRLTPIQEHKMIVSAMNRGIAAERIAKVLGINVERVHHRENLLRGIVPEAAELLKVRMVSQDVFRSLRQMKPLRQIETVEMMISANCFTTNYARMVLTASRPEMLMEPKKNQPQRSVL